MFVPPTHTDTLKKKKEANAKDRKKLYKYQRDFKALFPKEKRTKDRIDMTETLESTISFASPHQL